MNKVKVAKARAKDILAEYNLKWGIRLTNARKTLAVTDHLTKKVELSVRFIAAATIEDFDGIMHHEVAHILAGPGKGHGEEFVRICQQINPNERYSCDNYPIHIKKYLYTCPNCGVLGSQEKREKLACVACLNRGEKVRLKVEKNNIVTVEWASTP